MEASQTQTQQPDPTTLAALVVVLLSGSSPETMRDLAAPLLAPFGIGAAAIGAAIGLLFPHLDHGQAEQPVSAIGHTLRTQPAREAAYLFNAAKRIATDPRGVRAAIRDERRYVGQHLAAERGRRDSARAVDKMVAVHGPVLGWYSIRDERSTPGCRAMHSRNFNAAIPPIVEGKPAFPGAVHVHCRCKPGAPFPAAVREPARVLVGA
jgi:hypothetical protein